MEKFYIGLKNIFLHSNKAVWIVLMILGIIAKLIFFPHENSDYLNYILPWTNFIKENGYFSALQHNFYDYTPSYIYILAILSKTGLNTLYSVKIVSILFEYLLAYFIGRIVYLKYNNKMVILASLAIIPLIPSVILNSAYWSQCDSIYAAFAVGSIYFLLKNKSWYAVLFLGIAFSFKLQTVMILPFFFVMMLRGNIKWYSFFVIPIVYFVSVIPTWILGRPLSELLTIYFSQANFFRLLTMNFPNLYIWVNNNYYDIASSIGIVFTFLFTLISGIILSQKKYNFSFENWIRLAFLSAIIIPFFLPGMHERYMYLGDVLGVLYFLVIRKNIHFPIGIISVSTYSYIRCSRFNEILPMEPAFFVYLLIIVLVIIDFVKSIKKEEIQCCRS
jgi:Gpi18-like mannosyltransferase